jgi:hypothetical protein
MQVQHNDQSMQVMRVAPMPSRSTIDCNSPIVCMDSPIDVTTAGRSLRDGRVAPSDAPLH